MLDSSFLHITNNAQHWSWEHFELPVFSSEEIYDIGPFLLYACICAQMTITTVLNTEIYIFLPRNCVAAFYVLLRHLLSAKNQEHLTTLRGVEFSVDRAFASGKESYWTVLANIGTNKNRIVLVQFVKTTFASVTDCDCLVDGGGGTDLYTTTATKDCRISRGRRHLLSFCKSFHESNLYFSKFYH